MKRIILAALAVLLAACKGTAGAGASPAPRPQEAHVETSSIASDKLERFRRIAEENSTDALVVVKDGNVVLRYQRPGTRARFDVMSVTKSIASLVFGQLVDAGLVHLEDKLSVFYPQWSGDPRGDIIVRHVLAHATGLADGKTTEKIYANGDFIGFALDAKLEHPPGERFFYSNKASNLLSGIVKKVTGRELADIARESLFAKLDITDPEWLADNAGHTQVMAGLSMTADDLARIGDLVSNEGAWSGRQIVNLTWIETSTRTFSGGFAPPRGLFWWLKAKSILLGFDKECSRAGRTRECPRSSPPSFARSKANSSSVVNSSGKS